MAIQRYFFLACLAGNALSQICNCPLVGIITTTTTPACPTGDVLTITSTSTAGACRNPRTTTTTTTRTAGACNCPTQTTVTSTATPDCPDVTSTATEIKPTIDCPWAATATHTITQYGLANITAFPPTASGSGRAASTGLLPTGTAPAGPTCPLADLPESFYIRDALAGYLLYDPSCRKAVRCPRKEDATPFHVNETDPGDLGGVPQLSLYYPPLSSAVSDSSESEAYGAYVTADGGAIQFFRADEVPEEEDWFIVTAGWSGDLCELGLSVWNLHDLSSAQDCAGVLALGYGFGEEECPGTRLTVEAA